MELSIDELRELVKLQQKTIDEKQAILFTKQQQLRRLISVEQELESAPSPLRQRQNTYENEVDQLQAQLQAQCVKNRSLERALQEARAKLDKQQRFLRHQDRTAYAGLASDADPAAADLLQKIALREKANADQRHTISLYRKQLANKQRELAALLKAQNADSSQDQPSNAVPNAAVSLMENRLRNDSSSNLKSRMRSTGGYLLVDSPSSTLSRESRESRTSSKNENQSGSTEDLVAETRRNWMDLHRDFQRSTGVSQSPVKDGNKVLLRTRNTPKPPKRRLSSELAFSPSSSTSDSLALSNTSVLVSKITPSQLNENGSPVVLPGSPSIPSTLPPVSTVATTINSDVTFSPMTVSETKPQPSNAVLEVSDDKASGVQSLSSSSDELEYVVTETGHLLATNELTSLAELENNATEETSTEASLSDPVIVSSPPKADPLALEWPTAVVTTVGQPLTVSAPLASSEEEVDDALENDSWLATTDTTTTTTTAATAAATSLSSTCDNFARPKPLSQRKVSFDPLALLLDAALEGEIELVMQTAAQVADPSAPNNEGITALHNAICAQHFDIVKYLVDVGCDVNAPDADGWTPLHCAASCNNLSMACLLVEHGAAVFLTTHSDGETPFMKCEEDGDEAYIQCSSYLADIERHLGTLNDGLVYCVFAYEAENADELSFQLNEQLKIKRTGDEVENEWWWAEKTDDSQTEGYVPRNFLALYPRSLPSTNVMTSSTMSDGGHRHRIASPRPNSHDDNRSDDDDDSDGHDHNHGGNSLEEGDEPTTTDVWGSGSGSASLDGSALDQMSPEPDLEQALETAGNALAESPDEWPDGCTPAQPASGRFFSP